MQHWQRFTWLRSLVCGPVIRILRRAQGRSGAALNVYYRDQREARCLTPYQLLLSALEKMDVSWLIDKTSFKFNVFWMRMICCFLLFSIFPVHLWWWMARTRKNRPLAIWKELSILLILFNVSYFNLCNMILILDSLSHFHLIHFSLFPLYSPICFIKIYSQTYPETPLSSV